ncbi:hypothetical protein CK203_072696 [Vitis vinifera]|uniref:Transposon Ty3-I Gag-Pol polyprotein n=1 Tax=Vitis vinifera TaxID=29760 RepID=A0A438EZ27_VITVI|nr:hypothetical protein CK203_072696 [Vitis vinifera]
MVSFNETSEEEGLIEDEENILGVESRKTKEEEGVVASLQHPPSPFSTHEMLQLPNEMLIALIQVLKNPTLYATKIKGAKRVEDESHNCAKCCAAITFTNEDLQLGSKLHNRPLFVTGYIREQNITRILIDGGSVVNIMPKATMKRLGIATKELTWSCLMIQGFNQGGQRAIGMICLELVTGELSSNTLFHVIDANTSYNVLLGRPWLHENGLIPSTLHQHFKFYIGGVKKVEADTKPFIEVESYFADAKFYIENDAMKEVLLAIIPSIGKAKLKGKVEQCKSTLVEEISQPMMTRIEEKEKSSKKSTLDLRLSLLPQFLGEKMHGLNESQKKLKQQGYAVKPSRAGLGFVPFEPIKISAKTKKTKASTQHITVEDMEESCGSNSPHRISIFDLIEAPITRASVFTREVKYPAWIANIVPVKKKNGQIRVCVDFRDLNNACPKDDFPLPIIKLMVDATTGHEALSFMDGSSGYNQIRMALRDDAFWTKECRKREDHLRDLYMVFDRLRRYQLKMNPLKCAFGVTSGQALADFLADHPIPIAWEISDDFPNEEIFYVDIFPSWMMFFDGLAHYDGTCAGVVFVSPQRQILPYSFVLSERCSNNVAE